MKIIFQKSLLGTGFPYTSRTDENDLNDVLKKKRFYLLSRFKKIRFSASLDLCYGAKGTYEGYC